MVAKLRPLQDRLLVKPLEDEQVTQGGIIIPDTVKEKPMRGRVLAAGSGGRTDSGRALPMGVKVGDTILYAKWSGTEVKVAGEDLLVLKESDAFGILE